MKILITGGAGFIGSHLAESLLDDGHSVIEIDNLSSGNLQNLGRILNHAEFSFVKGSVTNKELLIELISEVDSVIHLAAIVGVSPTQNQQELVRRVNYDATLHLLELCARLQKSVLFASSSEVYHNPERTSKQPLKETDEIKLPIQRKGRWLYAHSKRDCEIKALELHKKAGLKVIIARLFNVAGVRQNPDLGMVIPNFMHAAFQRNPLTIHGDGRQTRSFSHVYDVVSALKKLNDTQSAFGEIVNVGALNYISILELAEKIITLCDSSSEIIINAHSGENFEDVEDRLPDITKLEKLIGFTPEKTLDEILKDYYLSLHQTNS